MGESRDRTVLITGVAGFIGRYVARHFSEQAWSVMGIDQVQPENAPLQNLSAYHSLRLPDKRLAQFLQHAVPRVCIHCAGRASVGHSVEDPASDFYDGSVMTFELLNALRLYAPGCRFILLSSAAVYGNPRSLPVNEEEPTLPISPYGFHKLQCELLALEFARVYGLATASVRVFSAYGAGLRRQVIWDMCEKMATWKSLELHGTGEETRDFVHAADVTRALALIAEAAPMEGEAYNIGSGKQVSIAELANMIRGMLGFKDQPRFDGIVPRGDPLHWEADITRIKSLGFSPKIELEEGIRSFVKWCREELASI
jgi:UDP-glucose 4-epimerase